MSWKQDSEQRPLLSPVDSSFHGSTRSNISKRHSLPLHSNIPESHFSAPSGFSNQGSLHGFEEDWSVPIGSGRYKTHQSERSFSKRQSSQRSIYLSNPEYNSYLIKFRIFAHTVRRTIRSIFTPVVLRILFVIALIGFCIFLFVNTGQEKEFELIAFSAHEPYIWKVSGSNLKVLEAKIKPQAAEDEWHDPQVFVVLEGKLGSEWLVVSNWSLDLTDEEDEHYFDVYDKDEYSSWRFLINTNVEDELIASQFQVAKLSKVVKYETIFAAIVLVIAYGLIVTEVIDRSLAAMVGALLALSVYSTLHEAPSFEKIVSWIDYETTGLLFGMMIMVGVFSETGFFEWSAVKAYKFAKGDGTRKDSVVMMNLALLLCVFTAFVSAFLDNVTTILLLSKVTIRLCDVLGVDPVPILIAEVLFSNIGGTATPIGDPPNIIIINNDDVAEEVNFGNFFLHVAPGIIICGVVCCFVTKRMLEPYLVKRGPPPSLQNEIQIWESTLHKLKNDTDEERQVRKQLRQHIQTLVYNQHEENEQGQSPPPDISELEKKYVIHDVTLLKICSLVLSVVILCFFIRSAFESSLTPAIISIVGALTLLLAAGINKMEEVLKNVEWETLIFFSCLFVLMECLSELGLVDLVGDITSDLVEQVPSGDTRLAVAIIIIIWVSAFVSALIDNIPYTAAMVPVIVQLSEDDDLPLQPLVWALVYGSCLGGNGTLTGASANVVCAGISGTNGHPISFVQFTKMGFPVMIVCLICVTVYMLVFHVIIAWY